MTDKTKQRIKELVPEINLGGFHDVDLKEPRYGTITLAVVLRALGGRHPYSLKWTAYHAFFVKWEGAVSEFEAEWNLTKNNYDDQSEETKLFIGKLLGV
jgi:hypothetical protein